MSRSSAGLTLHGIRQGLKQELRGVLRQTRDLALPFREFQEIPVSGGERLYLAVLDTHPRRMLAESGIAVGRTIACPHEPTIDRVYEYAKAVWHLRDRIQQFAAATNQQFTWKGVATASIDLRLCSDLANSKKHGASGNDSKLKPLLDIVEFDVSACGRVRFCYEGTMKWAEIFVSEPNPIPFVVPIRNPKGENVRQNARLVITSAFREWVTEILRLGVLSDDDRESEGLRSILAPPGQD